MSPQHVSHVVYAAAAVAAFFGVAFLVAAAFFGVAAFLAAGLAVVLATRPDLVLFRVVGLSTTAGAWWCVLVILYSAGECFEPQGLKTTAINKSCQ